MYDNVTTHEGDLVINGTQTFVIENCAYTQKGNVYVRDEANLVVRSAEFVIYQEYGLELGITVSGNATMSTENANMTSVPVGFGLDVWDNSKASIDGGLLDGVWVYSHDNAILTVSDTKITGQVGVYEPSKFNSSNSTISDVEIIFNKGYIEISNVSPGFLTYWSLQNLTGVDFEFNVTLINSIITNWGMSFSGSQTQSPDALISNSTIDVINVYDFTRMSIVNSTINGLGLGLWEWNEALSLVGIRPGFFAQWSLREWSTSSNVNLDITIVNSEIRSWGLEVGSNDEMTIIQSEIGGVSCHGESRTSILDSTIGFIYSPSGNPLVSVSDSKIGQIKLVSLSPSVSISNSSIDYGIRCWNNSTVYATGQVVVGGEQPRGIFLYDSSQLVIINASVYISGNITSWSSNAVIVTNSIVCRNFTCITQTEGSYPIEDAVVTLYDKNNVAIWKGTSNSSGITNFSPVFTDGNYTDTLRLEASKEDLFATKNITFLSDTPVALVMVTTATADINNDGSVDIYDAILLANAYNSIPTSPNWNSKADLNSDNIVDIYDAIILASNYGKTA
jgi:hypothetical protein